MAPKFTSILAVIAFSACRHDPVPQKYRIVGNEAHRLLIDIDEDMEVVVRQHRANPRTVAISTLADGRLGIVQIEKGPVVTPRMLILESAERAEFSVTASDETKTMIVDQDGDGLADIKIVGAYKYKRSDISWEPILREKEK